ncbi:hypothetical protein [Dongia sp.]|uniref:hypothetical protein n=1 Tax=Dongia sp. TaxID=1977262 RepID=UPI0035B1C3E1
MKAFGIGCLWFGSKCIENEGDVERFDPEEHLAAIQKSLEAIPNLSDLKIDRPENLSIAVSFEAADDDDEIFPVIPNVQIKFKLYLPKRIQDQIFKYRESLTDSEHFEVLIKYGYRAAVAFISYSASVPPTSPADCVVVVRKYLEQQVNKNNKTVDFRTLGPSPFHVDFLFEAAHDGESIDRFRFVDSSRPGTGYGDITVEYNRDRFSSIDAAWVAFTNEMNEQIENYYVAVQCRNAVMSCTYEVEEHLNSLLKLQMDSGLVAFLSRFWKAPSKTRDLMISLLEAERHKLTSTRFLDECRRDGLIKEGSPFSAHTVRRIAEQNDRLPVGQIGEVVRLFEERHLKKLEGGVVLVAGVLGGAVGAIVTLFLGR